MSKRKRKKQKQQQRQAVLPPVKDEAKLVRYLVRTSPVNTIVKQL